MIHDINREATITCREENGQTMTEYALILAAVAIVAIVGYLALGTAVTTLINNVVKCL
jgi:Flp pilus assembly pilin Flp